MLENLVIDRKSGDPVSNQIANFLRKRITNNEIQIGARLPTTKEVIGTTKVGSQTFRKAIDTLKKEGLVEPIPKRGTFVKSQHPDHPMEEITGYSDKPQNTQCFQLAIMGTTSRFKTDSNKCIAFYRPETMAGILKECELHRIFAVVFPSETRDMSGEDIYLKVKEFGCNGIIWACPIESELPAIDHLRHKSIPVVVTNRGHNLVTNHACILTDYDQAAFIVGNHFIDIGYDKTLLFLHVSETMKPMNVSFRLGLVRAFLMKKPGDSTQNITTEEYEQWEDAAQKIITRLERCDSKRGIIFTNALHFLNLLKTEGQRVRELLQGREFVIVSNHTINLQLAPLMGNLNPLVLIDPFEDIGKAAVQKTISLIRGCLDSTTTLVGVKVERFQNLFVHE